MTRIIIIITCVSWLVLPASSQYVPNYEGSYLVNFYETLRKNRVKTVKVKNCLPDVCLEDTYFINESGKVTQILVYPMDVYSKYEYDSLNRLKRIVEIEKCLCEDSIIYHEDFHYKTDGVLNFSVKHYSAWTENTADTTDAKFEVIHGSDQKFNKKKQLIQYSEKKLNYTCGNYFTGNFILKFTYNRKGLINTGKIYDDKNNLIIDIKYEYTYY